MNKKQKTITLIVVGSILVVISIVFLLFKLDVFKTNQNDNDIEEIGTLASNKIKVTFNANGGSVSKKNVSIKKGSKIGTLPTPTRKNYKFVGWYTKKSGGSKVTKSTKFSKATTIYARWQAIAVTKVKLNKTSANVEVGKTITLNATIAPTNATNQKITWTSSNTKLATVDKNGKVKGIKSGSVTITATSNNGKKATCKITVKDVSNYQKSASYVANAKKYHSSECKLSTDQKYEGSTLKYRIIQCGFRNFNGEVKGDRYALIWLKDPNKQIHAVGELGSVKDSYGFKSLISNNPSMANKAYIGINASFFACRGNNGTQPCLHIVRRDGKDVATVRGELIPSGAPGSREYGMIGIKSDGSIGSYSWGKYEKYGSNQFNEYKKAVDADGIRNTFAAGWKKTTFNPTDEKASDYHTILCQIDNNTFAIYTGMGGINQSQYRMYQIFNCKSAYNLDGGHSTKMVYYNKSVFNRVFYLNNNGREQPVSDMMIFMEK